MNMPSSMSFQKFGPVAPNLHSITLMMSYEINPLDEPQPRIEISYEN